MAFRKSLSAMRDDERNVKDKRGNWRHTCDQVDGITFNQRACYQPPGFARGAQIAGFWKRGMRGGSRD